VYIDNGPSKYECEIGKNCNLKMKSEIPVVGYTISEDGVLRKKLKNSKDDVVLEKLYESSYLKYPDNKFLRCINGGYCEEDKNNDHSAHSSIKYDKESKSIVVKLDNKQYISNFMRTIYIFNSTDISNSLKKDHWILNRMVIFMN